MACATPWNKTIQKFVEDDERSSVQTAVAPRYLLALLGCGEWDSIPSKSLIYAMSATQTYTLTQRQSAKKEAQKSQGLTEGEKAAMRETIQERKLGKANDESAVLAKIAGMREPDQSIARKLHVIIKATAPALSPRTWYGMPAYAKDDKVVCYFQSAQKFKARYSTLGFSDKAKLDESQMWPVVFALKKLGSAEETKVRALVKKAVG